MCIVQEDIDNEVIADIILSSEKGKRAHFKDGIPLEKANIFDRNDMCNDLGETFCDYNIDDQLDVPVCHL